MMAYKINDRRASALGGQSRDRSRSAITTIGWHYSAVMRKVKSLSLATKNIGKTRSVGIAADITFTLTQTRIFGKTMTMSVSHGE